MRKLDVKEIHGYNNARGLKLIKLSAIGKQSPGSTHVGAAAPSKSKAAAKQGDIEAAHRSLGAAAKQSRSVHQPGQTLSEATS